MSVPLSRLIVDPVVAFRVSVYLFNFLLTALAYHTESQEFFLPEASEDNQGWRGLRDHMSKNA